MPQDYSNQPLDQQPAYLSPAPGGGLYWGPLVEGRLVRRYKRFLADVELPGGGLVTAHTANTGRMIGCSEPGRPVWLSVHDRPERKYPYSLEMISMPGSLVGVNTMVPNRLVARAAEEGLLGLGPVKVETEVVIGHSRLDLRLTPLAAPKDMGRLNSNQGQTSQEIYVEVKNCTMAEDGTAYFPDAVTARGAKHMDELAILAQSGRRAVVLVLIQRADASRFSPADHIDPQWGRHLRGALAAGVELWPFQARLDLEKISLGERLPVFLP